MQNESTVTIVGAGPIGIACAVALKQAGIDYRLIDQGLLCDALFRLPRGSRFFSTCERLEIGGLPFLQKGHKPSREELLNYYKRVVEYFEIEFEDHTALHSVKNEGNSFQITDSKGQHRSQFVILATGFYNSPNRLNIAGEDLPYVSHYYEEPHRYYRKKLFIIGGANSAAEAALECQRYGAHVTLIHRGPAVHPRVKYWVKPDLENRIREGSIKAYFNSEVKSIQDNEVVVESKTETGKVKSHSLIADYVLLLSGYHSDFKLLKACDVPVEGKGKIPVYDENTMQTPVQGLFLAGVVAGGVAKAGDIFIENGREQAIKIAKTIRQQQ